QLAAAPPRLDPDAVLNDLLVSPAPEAVARLIDADGLLARELVEDRLLPLWGEAVLAGRVDDATRLLAVADLIAEQLKRAIGDRLTVRIVTTARNCPRRSDLARAHVTWRDARAAYARNDPQTFGRLFRKAGEQFAVCGSPISLWGQHYDVVRRFFEGH